MIREVLAGDTPRFTWIDSGVTPSALTFSVFTGSETVINSLQATTSSGDGHYFADYTVPTSLGYYAYRFDATINSNPYPRKGRFKVIAIEVD